MSPLAKRIHLFETETADLQVITRKGTHNTRVQTLLLLGTGKSRQSIEAELGISASQYWQTRQWYLTDGLATALEERPRNGQPTKITAELEAHVTHIACSEAPAGTARWTLALITEQVIELNYMAAISDETIRKVLKKSQLRPWLEQMWCIGTMTGEYLANLKDMLALYAQPADAGVTRLCFDERPCQLLDQVLSPIPAKPGATRKEYQDYLRKDICNVLLAYNINTSQRHLRVTATKTKADYARFMDWVVATHYPDVPTIKLVQDNYSTHTYGAFYKHLPVGRVRQLRHQLAFHFTPKHDSWLNRTDIEFSALSRQCLNRRIGSAQQLEEEALI